MINLVSLLVATVLVSLQCGLAAHAQIESKNDLDNNLQPNVVPTPKRRVLRPFVNILDPPPESARFAPGTRLELTCEVVGKPAPAAQWLKNDQMMTEADYDEINEIVTEDPSSVARLMSKVVVTSAANGDEYTCVATAGLKQDVASTKIYTVEDEDDANIFTLESLFRKPSKPTITQFYFEIFQDIGTTVVLPCRYHGSGKSQLYWTDSKNELVFGNSRMRVLPSGDLVISGVRWEDMGNYTCTVKNKYGKDSVQTFLYPAKKQ